MKKIYPIKCSKYRKFINPKISYIFDKTLLLSVICGICDSEGEELFEEKKLIEILKIFGLIKILRSPRCTYNCFKA